MCHSALVEADLKVLERTEKVVIDLDDFERYFEMRLATDILIPKALETNFNLPRTPQEKRIQELIETYRTKMAAEYRTDLAKQKDRLADAEAKLATKPTKKAAEDQRIATKKISWNEFKLNDLTRVERKETDSRIFPKWFAPVIVLEGNQRVVRLMRYLCRPENIPEIVFKDGKRQPFDVAYKGCYNARRDNLDNFWKKQFAEKHGYLVITSFYENVELHKYERREKREDEAEINVVVHFNPQPKTHMRIACLWSSVENQDMTFNSFTAVTDEPTPDVAAAGHDRGLIPMNDDSLDAWLRPDKSDLARLYAALDNRIVHRYEFQEAA